MKNSEKDDDMQLVNADKFYEEKEYLLPCPFCDGEARLEQISGSTGDEFVVTCKNSKCCAFYIGYQDEGLYKTKSAAINAWNTRKPINRIIKTIENYYDDAERYGFACAVSDLVSAVKEEYL